MMFLEEEDTMVKVQREEAVCKPRREASAETNTAGTLIFAF